MIGIKKNPMLKISTEDKLTLDEIMNGVSHNYIPEQERNFDAGYSPEASTRKYVGEELIGGKWYKVYQ